MSDQFSSYDVGPLSKDTPDRIAPEWWLAAIVESSDDAIIGESLDGIITSWNGGAERIFGYSAQEAIGRPISQLVCPGDENEIEQLLTRLRIGERVDHFQTVRRHKNGGRVLVSLSLSPIVNANSQVIGVAKIARDMTDRVAMEHSLTASTDQVRLLTEKQASTQAEMLAERRFRELIENAPDGILQVDEKGSILIANRTAERLFGYSAEELLGASVDLLVPDAHRAGHDAKRGSFGRAGISRPMGQGLDLYARRNDGTEFPVEISLSPIKTDSGIRVTAVIRDVSERKRIQDQVRALQESYMAELQDRQKDAERSNRLKSEFMAGITHELRTPLHTIIGFSDLLDEELEGSLNEAQRSFVSHIRRDSEHLLGLINDLLDFSRLETGGLHLNTEKLTLAHEMEQAVASIGPHAGAKGVSLRMQPVENITVSADSTRIRQVLYNLLSNAVKFTPKGGDIEVRAAAEGDYARVTIADTGVGIPAEEQERIFDRFYQMGYTSGGAGLGLAICKQLVEMQGGTISVESQVAVGSCFHFTLPKAV